MSAPIDHNISRIRAFRKAKGWSYRQFAREAGIADSTIRGMDDEDWSPSYPTIKALETVIPSAFKERVRN